MFPLAEVPRSRLKDESCQLTEEDARHRVSLPRRNLLQLLRSWTTARSEFRGQNARQLVADANISIYFSVTRFSPAPSACFTVRATTLNQH